MMRRNLRIPVVETSASAGFFSESEKLQLHAFSQSRKSVRLRQSMKEESLAPSCLHQDTITTAKKLHEVCIDIDSRIGELQYRAQVRTLLPPAMQVALAGFVRECQSQLNGVMMGKCKPEDTLVSSIISKVQFAANMQFCYSQVFSLPFPVTRS